MRITYFTNHYPAVSHTFIKRELLALEALGHEVQRVSLRGGAALVDEEDQREAARTENLLDLPKPVIAGHMLRRFLRRPGAVLGTLVFAMGLARRTGIGIKMLAYYAEALVLSELCAKFGSQLVRVHFGTNGATVVRLCRRVGGPAYSVAYHGPDEFDAPVKWDLGGVVAESAFVTAITSFCSAQLKRWTAREHWDRVKIVRCAVNERFLEVVPIPDDGPRRVCVVARLSAQKGLPVLIEAFAAARNTGLHLDIVGDGEFRSELEAMVAKHGLTDRVVFHGSLSGEGVRSVLEGASAMVMSSFAEGLPVVLMEAMGLGRPAIAPSIMGIPELVRPGENGWLGTTGDAESLADGLRAFADTSRQELERMGRAAHEAARERHSIDTEAAKLDGAIRALAGAG
ncbi:MAG: glycosyltransferase family 4 protein [Planctomycetota bacterium]